MFDVLDDLEAVVHKVAAAETVDDIARLRRLVDRLECEFVRQVGRMDDSGSFRDDGHLTATSWVRDHCRLSPGAASSTVKLARTLKHLPILADAFATGEISQQHAVVVAAAATRERLYAITEVEEALVDAARAATPLELRRVVGVVCDAIDGNGGIGVANALHERRRLHISPTLGGMVAIDGLLDAESGEIVMTAIEQMIEAEGEGFDHRRPAQRRADALVEICRGEDRAALPQLTTIFDLEILERRAGPKLALQIRNETAHGQALAPETLRRLACDASISRVITDGPSRVLDVGRTTRTVPAALRRAVVARDRHCRFLGCDRPPGWCDAHHIIHWINGGKTSIDNLILLCRRHHRAVHEGQIDAPPITRVRDGP